MTQEQNLKVRQTIALLSSMINSGELHSEQSEKLKNESLSILSEQEPFTSGVYAIAKERVEQIEKHGRTIKLDVLHNSTFEKPLTKAASALTVEHGLALAAASMKPEGWSEDVWHKMMSKPYKDRLIIAGALIAAEIDRLNAIGE